LAKGDAGNPAPYKFCVKFDRAIAEVGVLQLGITLVDHKHTLLGWIVLKGHVTIRLPLRRCHRNVSNVEGENGL